ncbi:MAG: DUF3168 domain-containing protein [Alphaproteobacteria bacterium]|nr:DUF3168 domain-containing protein [Alphaproteobacteria bacterium]
MTDPGWALQTAVYGALTTDPALIDALGGPHIYDHVPRKTVTPYVTFAQSMVRDWSTGEAEGHEHTLTLHVWAGATGRKKVAAVQAAIRTVLHDAALTLTGHRLVNMRHEFSEVRRIDDGDTLNGIVRLRAVTEKL